MGAENPVRRQATARSIAQRTGASTRTIQRIMAEPRAEYLARAARRRERIAELRRQGWTYATIATEVGVTVSAVGVTLHHLRKNGTDTPPASPKHQASEEGQHEKS